MGCAPPRARYRRTHREAWRYLLDEIKPDIALVQEALSDAPIDETEGSLVWGKDRGSDSGTAVFVRQGIRFTPVDLQSEGSYVACAEVSWGGRPVLLASIHVGPPNYRKHLKTLAEVLEESVGKHRFVVGGDLNAARHVDNVYGGKWFNRYFANLAERKFVDCHWTHHGKEVQSFWGHQAREAYQCDHLLADEVTAAGVSDCSVVDNAVVRVLSDHGPIWARFDGVD